MPLYRDLAPELLPEDGTDVRLDVYQRYQHELAPPWLRILSESGLNRTAVGGLWLKAFGSLKDWQVSRLIAVMQARLLLETPEDGLALLGSERDLPRYPLEPTPSYRNRVHGAWEFWAKGGTVPGIMLALKHMGYSSYVIEHFREDRRIWAEFSVLLWPDDAEQFTDIWDDGGVWDDGSVWEYRFTGVNFNLVRQILNKVKAAHARLRYTFFSIIPVDVWDDGKVWSGPEEVADVWNDGSNWDDGSIWDQTLLTGRVIDDQTVWFQMFTIGDVDFWDDDDGWWGDGSVWATE
jgi:hypothetical protein